MSDKILITNVTMKNNGALILTCDVELVPWAIVLREVRYFETGQKYWIGMPCRSWKTEDGQWQNKELIQFKDDSNRERFRKTICDKIREMIAKGIDQNPEMSEELPF